MGKNITVCRAGGRTLGSYQVCLTCPEHLCIRGWVEPPQFLGPRRQGALGEVPGAGAGPRPCSACCTYSLPGALIRGAALAGGAANCSGRSRPSPGPSLSRPCAPLARAAGAVSSPSCAHAHPGTSGVRPCCCTRPSAHLSVSAHCTHAEPSAGAGARPLLPAGTLGSGSLSGTVCHAGRGTGPSLGVTKGGEREQVQWSLHTHMEAVPEDCKSVRGRLAPPSALHARALTLAGVMPADRERVGEARVGRNCC